MLDDRHVELVRADFNASEGFADVTAEDVALMPGGYGDPLYAVWGPRGPDHGPGAPPVGGLRRGGG